MSRNPKDPYGRYVRKIHAKTVARPDGDIYRFCTLAIPKDYSDSYSDSQQFVVEKLPDGSLLFTPLEVYDTLALRGERRIGQ